MRIVVASDLWVPFPGGAERLIFNLARDLQRRGEDVQVLTGYGPAKQFDGPPFEVIEVPETDEGGDRLFAAIHDAEPDVILTHHYWALTFEEQIRRVGIPTVQVVLNGRVIFGAAFAVFISEFVRTRPGMEAEPSDLTIYPLAFDDVVADQHGDAIGFIKPLPHKGVDLFYEIARAMPERQFVCLRGEWQTLETIEELPNVEFLDPVDDIRDFYRRVRLVLVPSLSEDAGTVGQECALNGIPCISSDAGGLPETNRGGWIISGRDPQTWAEAIDACEHEDVRRLVTASQRTETPTSQLDALDEFHRRIRALAP